MVWPHQVRSTGSATADDEPAATTETGGLTQHPARSNTIRAFNVVDRDQLTVIHAEFTRDTAHRIAGLDDIGPCCRILTTTIGNRVPVTCWYSQPGQAQRQGQEAAATWYKYDYSSFKP